MTTAPHPTLEALTSAATGLDRTARRWAIRARRAELVGDSAEAARCEREAERLRESARWHRRHGEVCFGAAALAEREAVRRALEEAAMAGEPA
jgi:hypothetical protein